MAPHRYLQPSEAASKTPDRGLKMWRRREIAAGGREIQPISPAVQFDARSSRSTSLSAEPATTPPIPDNGKTSNGVAGWARAGRAGPSGTTTVGSFIIMAASSFRLDQGHRERGPRATRLTASRIDRQEPLSDHRRDAAAIQLNNDSLVKRTALPVGFAFER